MSRAAPVALLIGFILSAAVASAQSRFPPRGSTPLERSREPAATRAALASVIQGQVARVQPDIIVTTVSSGDLLAHDLGDGDRVSVEIGGKVLAARIASGAAYLAIVGDPAAAESLDVAILGVIDDRGPGERLVIVGLGGGIAEWLSARPGMPLTLRAPR